MPRLNANNLSETVLAENVASGDTSFSVDDASVFPEPPFRATIESDTLEVVEVEAVDGNTLSNVLRGMEATSASSHSAGSVIDQRFTAGMYSELNPSHVADVQKLIEYKKNFLSIRNRRDYIDYVFENSEDRSEEICQSQVLMNYIMEAENDRYDRFIDPNHELGLTSFSTGSSPALTELYEAAMVLGPTSFLEGLMTIESVADFISGSEILMDGVMEADPIFEDNFGFEEAA